MRKLNFVAITLAFLCISCAPAVSPAQAPTETPPPLPTSIATEAVILENPPACAGANLVYHSELQEVLLTGCVPGSVRQDGPNIIWGWNGERWRRVTEGGPKMHILGGTVYDEKRNVLVLYGGFSWEQGTCVRETWEWDGENWAQKDVKSPSSCDHLEMVYDATRGEVILFGGGDENQNLTTETWSWNGQEWMLVSDSARPVAPILGLPTTWCTNKACSTVATRIPFWTTFGYGEMTSGNPSTFPGRVPSPISGWLRTEMPMN